MRHTFRAEQKYFDIPTRFSLSIYVLIIFSIPSSECQNSEKFPLVSRAQSNVFKYLSSQLKDISFAIIYDKEKQ